MIYCVIENFNKYTNQDADKFDIKGYFGNVYGLIDKDNSSTTESEAWIEKQGYTIKTTSQAQALVDDGITEYNNMNFSLASGTVTQGGITLE